MRCSIPTLLLTAGVLVALAVAVSPASAQVSLYDTTAWEHLGATRQQIEAFAFSGDPTDPVVWAGFTGLYRLGISGGIWEELYNFSYGGPVFLIGTPPDTVFIGWSLHRSVNGGATFEKVQDPDDPQGRVASGGAISRFPPGSPYEGRLVVGDSPSLLYSDDGGDSWTRTETAPTHSPFQIHAFRSGRVLSVGFYGATLSDDGARTFRPVPGLYDAPRPRFDLTHLVVLDGFTTGRPGDSTEGRVLVVGTTNTVPGAFIRLWATDDEGDTWRETHRFEDHGWGGLAPVPDSVGGGPGWAIGAEKYGPLVGPPGREVVAESRLFATVDGGETWTEIGRVPETGQEVLGSPATMTKTIAVGPDGRLYAGTVKQGPTKSWSWRTKGRVADAIRLAVASEGEPEPKPVVSLIVFPNPTGSTATIQIETANAGDVRVAVADVRGREVAVVYAGPLAAGLRQWDVETAGWSAGVYVVHVESGGAATAARFTVAR